jgi:lysophospholipase L1-like esterase
MVRSAVMNRLRPWLVSGLVVVASLAALEILARLWLPALPFATFAGHPVLGYHLAAGRRVHAVTGLFSPPGCETPGAKHTITVGADGARVVPASASDSTVSVAVFGDSCSFGWDVSDDETFANRLAELARAEGVELSVRLHAVPGYSSLGGYLQYQLLDAPPPDVAVIAFGANDEDPVAASPWRGGLTDYELHAYDQGAAGEIPAVIRARLLLQDSGLVTLLTLARRALFGEPEFTEGETSVTRRMTSEQSSEVLDAWIGLLLSQGVEVIVHDLCSSSRADEVRQVAAAHGVTFGDTHTALMEEWRGHLTAREIEEVEATAERWLEPQCLASYPQMLVTTDDFHPNATGHRIVGDVLWPHVRDALAVPDGGKP